MCHLCIFYRMDWSIVDESINRSIDWLILLLLMHQIRLFRQALSNVGPIRDYFLQEPNYASELAKKQPGDVMVVLVQRFGELIRKMWNSRKFKAHVSPHEMLQAVVLCSKKRFQFTKQGMLTMCFIPAAAKNIFQVMLSLFFGVIVNSANCNSFQATPLIWSAGSWTRCTKASTDPKSRTAV